MHANPTPLDVLDQIHSAILSADFAALATLTPALDASMAQVEGAQDKALLAKINARAQRNAACLMAAGRGIRAAQRRLTEMRSVGEGFSTYDGRGKRAQHGLPTSFALRY